MSQRRGMLRRSQQWRIMATRPRHHAVAGRSDGKRLGGAKESSGAADEARGGEEGGAGAGAGSGIGDRDGRGSRIVSFEERIQVVLVPTRQELHEHQRQQQQLHQQRQLQLQPERLQQQQQQQQQQQRRQQEEKEDVGGRGDDAVLNEGIWWTRSDCNRFRRSFKRQILQQGLQNNVKTLLCPTLLVFRIGAEEERLEEQEKGRREEGGDGGDGGGGRVDGGTGSNGRATLLIAQDVGAR